MERQQRATGSTHRRGVYNDVNVVVGAMSDSDSSSNALQLEAWLNDVDDEVVASIPLNETISRATLAMLPGIEAPPPTSLAGLPTLDVSEEDAELRLTKELGRGGMGHVQVAEQRALRREVAVKRVLPDASTPYATSAILKEARVTGRLEHPNIVPVHMLGRDRGGMPVIVMKRVEGVRWRDLITDETARRNWKGAKVWSHDPVMRHLEILLEVCNAVSFAHAMGIVHRDIKPSNVMVGMFGEVYLLDWGIAVPIATASFDHAPPDEMPIPLGTPSFMTPEMVARDGVIDERTDVYQLGASLHQALTGVARHVGVDLLEVLWSAISSPAFAYPATVPAELAAICNRAMSKDPEARFPTVDAFRDALTHYMSHRSSLRLAFEAGSRLDALKGHIGAVEAGDDAQLAAVYRVFAECRFAFMQALSEWSDNDNAKAGLREGVQAMARLELARGNVEAAEALATELDVDDPALSRAISSARAEVEKKHGRLEGLEEMRKDLDLGISRRARVRMSIAMAAVALVLGGALLPIGRAKSLLKRSNWSILVLFAVFGLVFVVTVFRNREQLLQNTANRRVNAALGVGILGMMGQRLVSALSNIDMRIAGAADLLVCGVVALLAGATIDRGIAWMSAVYAVGVAVVLALPGGRATTLAFVATQAAALGAGAFYWHSRNDL